MKKTTGKSYRERLTRVVDYIYHNLAHELDVNTLADIALMSPYHFHRIYREIAGEPVNVTVRRLRLQKAAALLIQGEQPLTSIAQSVAYGSLESFSRAFSKLFGESPSEYRQARREQQEPVVEPFVAMLPTTQVDYPARYDVKISEFKKEYLIGIDHKGDYLNTSTSFQKLFIFAGEQGLLNDSTRTIGLYLDDPKSVDEAELRATACISVDRDYEPPPTEGIHKLEIPQSQSASVLYKGSYVELEKPYNWLFGSWLPKSGREAANYPPIEEYLNDPKSTPPNDLLTRITCLLE